MGKLSDGFWGHEVGVPCPNCGTENKTTLKQVQRGERITCRGCGKHIKLEATGDDMRSVAKAMDDLERSLKRLGNIKL